MLVELEPVWKCTKDEEEHRQTKEHKSSKYTRSIPNLSSEVRDQSMCFEAVSEEQHDLSKALIRVSR